MMNCFQISFQTQLAALRQGQGDIHVCVGGARHGGGRAHVHKRLLLWVGPGGNYAKHPSTSTHLPTLVHGDKCRPPDDLTIL